MSYNPEEYWRERGKIYQSTFQYNDTFRLQERFLLDALRKLSFSSVLEVGCGFGRITKLLLQSYDIQEYTAVDLSPDQIESAKKYVNNQEKVNFVTSNIQSFNSDKKFDLVVAAEVLLHVKPEEIEAIVAKLLSFTNHYFVHIDWSEDRHNVTEANSHNFMHDYDKIYDETGIRYLKQKIKTKKLSLKPIDTRQALFVVMVD
jgi:trans-aconitate methyltransferase